MLQGSDSGSHGTVSWPWAFIHFPIWRAFYMWDFDSCSTREMMRDRSRRPHHPLPLRHHHRHRRDDLDFTMLINVKVLPFSFFK